MLPLNDCASRLAVAAMVSRHCAYSTTYGVCDSNAPLAGFTAPVPLPWPTLASSPAPLCAKWWTSVDSNRPPVEPKTAQSPLRSIEPTHSGASGPPTHVPAAQLSAIVHAFASSHGAPEFGSCVH